ncbi:hypothetical protein OROMI_028179 [Orobanche minor]
MSGIVDIWTSELAKLRNKGRAVFTSENGSSPPSQVAAPVVAEKSGVSTRWPTDHLAEALQANKLPALQLSDAAVSMLVDSLSA